MSYNKIQEYKNSLPPLQEFVTGLAPERSGECHGGCPLCGGTTGSDRFMVKVADQRYWCRHEGCEFNKGGDIIDYIAKTTGVDLATQMREAGFFDEPEPRKTPAKNSKKESKKESAPLLPSAPHAKKKNTASFIWNKSKASSRKPYEYLEHTRKLKLAQNSEVRFNSYTDKEKILHEMIVLRMWKPGDSLDNPMAIQRIFLKKEGGLWRKTGTALCNGTERAAVGRAVWFCPDRPSKKIAVGEGPETMIAVGLATGMNYVSCLTDSGLKNIQFPSETEDVYFFIDCDAKTGKHGGVGFAGQKSGLTAARRAEKQGKRAFIVTPTEDTFSDDPAKTDFNDLYKEDQTGQSIRDRVAAAAPLSEIEWVPPASKVPGSLIDEETGKLVLQSKAAILLGDRLSGKFASSCIGSWYQFGGASWSKCEKGELRKEVVNILDQEAGDIGYNASYLAGSLSILQDSGRVALSDEPKNKIGFLNGLLDLKTMEFSQTTPENALQWHLPHVYREEADCPFFLSWLDSACGDPTGDTQWFIRAIFNAALVERGDLQFFIHFKGLPGTGKGTVVQILEGVVGSSNHAASSFTELAKDKFETRKYYKKRLIVFNEVPKHVDIQKFLSLTGRDSLSYDLKHSNVDLSFVYLGLIVLTGNEFMTTNDQTSSAIERRRRTILFDKQFTPSEREDWDNKGGTEALIMPEVPGIINWALGMSREEVSEVFHNPPEKVTIANKSAERTNSPLVPFIEENVRYCKGGFVHIGTKKTDFESGRLSYVGEDVSLYPRYLGWCDGEAIKPLSRARFKEAFIATANRVLGGDGRLKIYKVEGTDNKVHGGYPFLNVELVPLHATQEHHSESINKYSSQEDDLEPF